MVLTVKYKDGIRERKRAIVNVCAINYVEGADKLKITTNNTGKERFELKGEEFEFNLSKEGLKQMDKEHSNGWIPCSERLPEDDMPVLVAKKDGCMYVAEHIDKVRIGVLECEWKTFCSYLGTESVVAWHPLPEPYKGVQDDSTY